MNFDEEQIDVIRSLLKGQELFVFDQLVSIFKDTSPMYLAKRWWLMGLTESYLILFQFFFNIKMMTRQDLNLPYSCSQIVDELARRMRDTTTLKRGDRYYDGVGELKCLCRECGTTYRARNNKRCPDCVARRRRDMTAKSIDNFLERRKQEEVAKNERIIDTV